MFLAIRYSVYVDHGPKTPQARGKTNKRSSDRGWSWWWLSFIQGNMNLFYSHSFLPDALCRNTPGSPCYLLCAPRGQDPQASRHRGTTRDRQPLEWPLSLELIRHCLLVTVKGWGRRVQVMATERWRIFISMAVDLGLSTAARGEIGPDRWTGAWAESHVLSLVIEWNVDASTKLL